MRRRLLPLLTLAAVLLAPASSAWAVAAPTVAVSIDPTNVYLGDTATLVVSFDNNDGANAAGYGPYVDLLLPTADQSGDAGHGLQLNGAIRLGADGPVVSRQVIDCSTATLPMPHPFAMTGSGPALIDATTCPAGQSLVIMALPFGSYTVDQPTAQLRIPVRLSELANVAVGAGADLQASVRGGYRFGGDPLNNPATDPTVTSVPSAPVSIRPTLLDVRKTYVGPEAETSTGPNFARSYQVDAFVATGQDVLDSVIRDTLPDGIVVTGVTAVGASSVLYNGVTPSYPLITDGVSELEVAWIGVSAGAGATTPMRSITINYFVPNVLADGATELLPTGGDRTLDNTADVRGDWYPSVLANDGAGPVPVADSITAAVTIEAAAIVVQKRRSAGLPQVGDSFTYTISGQISDYYALDDIVITDELSDGAIVNTAVVPELVVRRGGAVVLTRPFTAAEYDYTPRVGNPGFLDLQEFRVSELLAAAPALTSESGRPGVLAGGCVANFPALYEPTSARELSCARGALTFEITYTATLLAAYQEAPTPGKLLVARDEISNAVNVTARTLDTNTGGWPDAVVTANGSSNSFRITSGSVTKRIFAVNGVICAVSGNPNSCDTAAANVQPSDVLTYYLSYVVPTPGVDDLDITEYLPLPALQVGAPTLNMMPIADDSLLSGTVRPYSGAVLPANTYSDVTASISSSVNGNSFTVSYGDTPATLTTPERVALLAKFTVSSDPFADELLLTNQLAVETTNTTGTRDLLSAYDAFTLREPELEIVKGIASSDNVVDDTYAPASPTPTISPAGSPVVLSGTPITPATAALWNANVTNLDASDIVRHVVSVSNIGGAPATNVELCDTLPTTGLVGGATPTVTNFTVIDSTGTVRSLTGGASAFFNCAGPAQLVGTLAADAVVFVIYDVQIDTVPSTAYTAMTNTASLTRYTNVGSTTNFLDAPLVDTATMTPTADTTITKTFLDGTGTPVASPRSLTIGEQVRYRVRVELDEAQYGNFIVRDALPAGLAFSTTAPTLAVSNPGLVTCATAPTPGDCTSVVGTKTADTSYEWNFGTLTNAQVTNGAAREYVEMTYWVTMRNVAGNTQYPSASPAQPNNARVAHDHCGGGAPEPACGTVAVNATVAEPRIVPTKSVTTSATPVAVPPTLDSADEATWTIRVPSNGSRTAFDVRVTDEIPTGFEYVDNSLTIDGVTCAVFDAVAAQSCVVTDIPSPGRDQIAIAWDSLAVGANPNIQFRTSLDRTAAVAGATVTNTVDVAYRSLPDIVSSVCATVTTCVEREYAPTASASVQVAPPKLTKSMVDSSDATTIPPNLAVGETAEYQVLVELAEGETPGLRVVDTLPAGMRFVEVVSVALGGSTVATDLVIDGATGAALPGKLTDIRTNANVANAGAATNPGIASPSGTRLGVNFGTVVNVGDTTSTTTKSLVIRYTAVVTNVISNQDAATRTNSAVAHYGATQTLPATVAATIVEPDVRITKTFTADTTTVPGVSLYRVDLVAAPPATSTATAYDVTISDTLPAGLAFYDTGAAAPVCTTTGTPLPTCSSNPDVGQTRSVTVDRLLPTPGATSATLRFWVRIVGTQPVGTAIANTGTVNWSSLAVGATANEPRTSVCTIVASPDCIERNGSDGVGAGLDNHRHEVTTNLATGTPATTKTRIATSATHTSGADVVVGERVRYEVVVTVPHGTTTDLRVTDVLQTGLAFTNETPEIVYAGFPAGEDPSAPTDIVAASDMSRTWDFGDVVNTDLDVAAETITIRYWAIVQNVAAMTSGATANNSAQARYMVGVTDTPLAAVNAGNVTVREPVVTLGKSMTNVTAGGRRFVEVQLLATNTSTVTAFDLQLTDVLADAGLEYVAAPPAPLAQSCAPIACATGPVEAPAGTVSATVAQLAGGTSTTVTFYARAASAHDIGTPHDNEADLTWTSLSGSPANGCATLTTCLERTGSGVGPNTYTDDAAVSIASIAPTLDKSLVSTDLATTTGASVAVGERITYEVVVDVPAGTMTNLRVVDTLQTGLAFVNVAPTVTYAGFGTNPTLVTSVISGASENIRTFAFGTVVNDDDDVTAETITIRYQAIVVNSAAVNGGLTANNDADLVWSVGGVDVVGGPSDNAGNVTVVEPKLTIVKTFTPALIDAGQTVRVRFTVAHAGGGSPSTADAHGVTITDPLPSTMRTAGGWVPVGFDPDCTITDVSGPTGIGTRSCNATSGTGTAVLASFDHIPLGATRTIEFNVMADTALAPGAVISNTAYIDWRSLPAGQGDTNACATAPCIVRDGDYVTPADPINDYTANSTAIAAGATVSTISGTVWADVNNDGVRDAGEALRIAGVTVTLTGEDLLNNPVTLTTTTDASGAYSFSAGAPGMPPGFPGLRPGTYTVTQTQPTGYLDGKDSLGNFGVPASPQGTAANDSFTVTFPLGASTTAVDYDFGELRPSSIAGRVWGEENGGPEDGVFNGADALLENVTLTLSGLDDLGATVTRTTTTDATGAYTFANVRPGTYTVTQTQPAAWATGGARVGTGTTGLGVIVDTNGIGSIVLTENQTGIAYDFWELSRVDVGITKQIVPTAPVGAIVGINTTYTWRIELTNAGPSDATNVEFTDDMAALAEQHLIVTAVTPQAGTTCGAWTQVAAPNLTCTTASIASGARTWVDLTVRVDGKPAAAPEELVNDVAVIDVDQIDTDPSNDTDTDTVRARGGDVGIVKTGSADSLIIGEQITWTLTVRNNGSGTDPAVTVRDTMPARSILVSTTPSRGTCTPSAVAGAVIDCALGAMASGDVVTIRIVAVVPEAGTYRNAATVTAGGIDENPANNASDHTVIVTFPGVGACTVEGDGVITGGAGDDVICGGGGDDVIECGGGNNTIIGGGGNDIIRCAGATCSGINTILGGTGNDVITVTCSGAIIDGGTGDDVITVPSGSGAYTLCGGAGNDTIRGGSGNDLIDGGPGNDKLYGNRGNDRIYGGAGNDLLDGGAGNDRLYGGAGNDRLFGRAGLDQLFGENGNDRIDGGPGKDSAHGGNGNDSFLMKDRAADRIVGGRGRDTLTRDRGLDRWTSVERVR